MRMRRAGTLALAAAVAGAATLGGQAVVSSPKATAGAGQFRLHKIGDFDQPDYIAHPPGTTRSVVFVVERGGTIRVVRNGTELARPFLNIKSRVGTPTDDGMGSIAFDPGYRYNRRFYVFYTRTDGNNEVDVFERSRHSAVRANQRSRRRVILIPHPNSGTHNGGQLQFGPDDHLYISSGDGGCCYDPFDQAYKLNTLLGKILRIDPTPDGGYTIPRGNPQVGKPGLDEIFAWGLRSPWRFSFDSETGRIAIGDVGQDTTEEIDYDTLKGTRGANFGWPQYEGSQLVPPPHDGRPGPGPPVFPIHTYPHRPGCAVIGGYVVRDRQLGSLYGKYVYSDYCSGDVRALDPHLGPDAATGDHSLGLTVPQASSFGDGYNGRIYIASLDGPVYRLVRRGSASPPRPSAEP
jgi:glucose/arabinose dehydrogenase